MISSGNRTQPHDQQTGERGRTGLPPVKQLYSLLNMSAARVDHDLTARANIRNAALRLFAERGHDAVTVRQIASAAEVSPGLVVHHFGSKDGLRAAVDDYATSAFDAVLAEIGTDEDAALTLTGGQQAPSVAEAFARVFPPGSPLPAYLRRLLLTGDPVGAALFGRWYAATRRLWDALVELGAARPSQDPAVRAAFLLANDLALILLRNQIATAIGDDPLTPAGLERWGREVTEVYLAGTFIPASAPPPQPARRSGAAQPKAKAPRETRS